MNPRYKHFCRLKPTFKGSSQCWYVENFGDTGMAVYKSKIKQDFWKIQDVHLLEVESIFVFRM